MHIKFLLLVLCILVHTLPGIHLVRIHDLVPALSKIWLLALGLLTVASPLRAEAQISLALAGESLLWTPMVAPLPFVLTAPGSMRLHLLLILAARAEVRTVTFAK